MLAVERTGDRFDQARKRGVPRRRHVSRRERKCSTQRSPFSREVPCMSLRQSAANRRALSALSTRGLLHIEHDRTSPGQWSPAPERDAPGAHAPVHHLSSRGVQPAARHMRLRRRWGL
jgi:hypothetical protein